MTTTTTRRITTGTLALVLTGGLVGCAQGGPEVAPSPTPARTTTSAPEPTPDDGTSPTPTASAEPTDALGGFTAPGTEVTSQGDATGYVVTDVRVGEHEGYDRVVYELTGGTGTPGYRVGYVDQAVEDPSGAVREVAGDAILGVWLVGTTYPVEGGPQEAAQDVTPADGDVAQVVRPLTFEGMTQSFVGLDDGPRPFRVTVLADPVRVVVDVQDD